MNRDLGGITLTSISSYIGGRFLNLVDGDGTIAPLLHIDFGSKTEEYSQDLRLSTNGSGPFNALVGLYPQRAYIHIEPPYLHSVAPPYSPLPPPPSVQHPPPNP